MSQNQPGIKRSEEEYSGYRWVIIGLLLTTQEISSIVSAAIGILLPSMRRELGFGVVEAGVLSAVTQAPMALLGIPASLFLVRFNAKWVYLISMLFAAVAGFFIGQAPAFIFLAVFYSVNGIAMTMRQVPDTLLKLQWIPKKQLATMMGISMGMGAMGQSTAVIAVPFLLIVLQSWRNLLSVYSLAIILLSVVWIIFSRERITSTYRDGMSSIAGRAPLKNVLKRKEFLIMGFAWFGAPIAYMTTFFFLPTYLLEERGLTLTIAGIVTGIMPIGAICATFSVGFVSDRIGLRKPLIWPAGIILPFLYFILFSPVPLWALQITAFFIGYLGWAPFPLLRTIPFELPGIKPSEVVVGQSLMVAVNAVAIITGAPMVGFLAERIGSLGVALRILCLFPLMLAISGLLLPETGPKAHQKRSHP
ncbi:MAG: MFS transporter [Chloroflexi bacterium]|nr:MFS transporter [Chloroflexota bacterium]